MVYSISDNEATSNFPFSKGKLFIILAGMSLSIAGLTIFQDFLESKRSGYDFYFSESLLFKTIWFLFIPILMTLFQKLKNDTLGSFAKTAKFIVSPIVIHLLILPFIATAFSVFFYEGRYDLFKFFSYTVAHDFYKPVLIYTGFVLGYKYFSKQIRSTFVTESKLTLDTIVIKNGKNNVIVSVDDIIQITSATPYISIHLENKKYLHSETLKSMCRQLDGNIFVQIHKSTVVNISKVCSFKSRLNGDYDLQLTSGEIVRLSRTYAVDFKKRFDMGHRVNI